MNFSEYAQGISPFCSFGKSEQDFFTEIIGNFIKDAAMDSCKILKYKPDTKYRYIKGTRTIQPKDAQYIYDYRDPKKFTDWILGRMDESESYDNVLKWLNDKGYEGDDPPTMCFNLLESIMLNLASKDVSDLTTTNDTFADFKLIEEIQNKIRALPKPTEVLVPKEATDDEQIYISELYRAYGDAEGKDDFSEADLNIYPEYAEDLDDRRIDFYAAETIRRGVHELKGAELSDQFNVLKDEMCQNVKDTSRRRHDNGYECMLAVMEQAVNAPVTNYLLSASPYWISGSIKKGVCHHLVNGKKLVWVKKRGETS